MIWHFFIASHPSRFQYILSVTIYLARGGRVPEARDKQFASMTERSTDTIIRLLREIVTRVDRPLNEKYNYEEEEALYFIILDDSIPAGAKLY